MGEAMETNRPDFGLVRTLGPMGFSVRGQKVYRNGVPIRSDPFGVELVTQICEFLTKALTHEQPLDIVRDFVAAETTFRILVASGFRHEPFLRQIGEILDEFNRVCRREFVRRLLLGIVPEETAKRGLRLLNGLMD